MGCKLSCCKSKNESPYKNRDSLNNLTTNELKYDETISSLQHISERETGDTDYDPSTNPTAGPIFIQRINFSQCTPFHRKSQPNLYEYRLLKKSSSCSTIFLDDSTVSHPNLNIMIKCVSMAIYYHIYNRSSDIVLDIFDEIKYPLEKKRSLTKDGTIANPDYSSIYRFMYKLFHAAQLSSECAIITLVYLERLLTYAEIDIVPCTWKRILLAAILLASKVWDDQAVWNLDYCIILKDIPIDNMNQLEMCFLELLQFNINVPSSVYAKYYFELRNLAYSNHLLAAAEPLSELRAHKLEAMSRLCESNSIRENSRKWCSASQLHGISFQRKCPAIIS